MPQTQKNYIDLHLHTTCSDGTLTPAEIVREALGRGLTIIAIADHDTSAGVAPALSAASGTDLWVVPAIELNTDYREQEVHVLGYGIDPEAAALRAALQKMLAGRYNRNLLILERLKELGVPVAWEKVAALAAGEVIARPHLARALVQAGHVKSVQEAFDRFLGKGAPAFIERISLTPQEACRVILESGGLPVLAHPGRINYLELIAELSPCGLRGVEVYHPDISPNKRRKLSALAKKLGLLTTGGSDYHGPDRVHMAEIGSVAVPFEVGRDLAAALSQPSPALNCGLERFI
jgi:predicted metal-dependent phosphoesterase TrpH